MRDFITRLAGPCVRQNNRMIRPQDRRGQDPQRGGGQHPGLLLQRYLCENATGDDGNPEEKRAILQAAINAARQADVIELYRSAFQRWQRSLPELTAANDCQTAGRVIVGLGSENVLETGIRLHHTYGMPILPGSALKGLAAHYCDWVWGERDTPDPSEHAFHFRGSRQEDRERERPAEKAGKYHSLLFGTTEDSGCILFHDAWFVPDSEKEPLKLDVMTPHHPKWLDGEVAPTDFDSPTPVPFLSVAGKFHVAVSWHGPTRAYDKSVAWTEKAFDLLLAALTHWGIGGKTSSGYGRLDETDARRRQPFSGSALGLPVIGSLIEATLQEAPKKQNKPWRAQVTLRGGKERSGPIEGTAPGSLQPGMPVRVLVAFVDEKAIRFQWPSEPRK